MKKKVLVSWSTGKDSAWALHVPRSDSAIEVRGLFSTLSRRFCRVSMHATRKELLCRQAKETGLPVRAIELPYPCANKQYEAAMDDLIKETNDKGIDGIAFGDIYLADVKHYREKQLGDKGIEPIFPLWGNPSVELAERMLATGLEAYVSSVDLKKLPLSFVGRRWSHEFVKELPEGIDPCGEKGEFHTVVVDGPMFGNRIEVEPGEVVQRNGFAYDDIRAVR